MRLLFLLLLAIAAAGVAYVGWASPEPDYEPPRLVVTPPPAPPVLLAEPGPGERVRVFEVEGMCCRTCTGKLHASVSAVAGVRAAAVSFEDGRASVIVPADLAVEPLLAALSVDKYSARPVDDEAASNGLR